MSTEPKRYHKKLQKINKTFQFLHISVQTFIFDAIFVSYYHLKGLRCIFYDTVKT
jgi:hypothetical protein